MRSNNSRQSKPFAERRRRRAIIGTIAGVLAVASWLFSLSRLSFISALAIEDVEVYGVEADLAPVMRSAALEAMSGAYLGIFSKGNAFTYPEARIVAWVASSSPRVMNVSVRRSGLHKLVVSVSEKATAAIICADLPDLSDGSLDRNENCYEADATGYVFKPVGGSPSADLFRYYIPDLAGKKLDGSFATSTEKFRTIFELLSSVKEAGIGVHGILLENGHDYELYADNPAGGSLVVITMNEDAGLEVQKENLIAYWNRMVALAKTKSVNLAWDEIKLQYPPNVYSRPDFGLESK